MEKTPETYLTPRTATEETEDRPYVKSVTVPEYIKRRIPSKHYVYKVVVNWTSGKQIIIYRKYSLFFDFVIKLNQMLADLSPELQNMQLPELPGRVLFGRTEVRQVAEKRRRKIEEFCQKVVDLPEEVSRSSLVLGFFNTWAADTLLRRPSIANTHVITAPVMNSLPAISESVNQESVRNSTSSSSSSIAGSSSFSSSNNEAAPVRLHQQGPDSARSPSPLSPNSQSDCSALESIISHPDEMENLEQYLVLADYERKDSHQVNLTANQHVYVIEKHDTGWWMVMSEDEQGYAPASYLEPVEGNSSKDEHLEEGTGQVYEAMESYFAENDDEITIKAGDKIEVVSKSMDGWWMIRCNGRTGLSPAALIRRRPTSTAEEEPVDVFESEKDVYEGLNIHKPPPRRNTIYHSNIQRIPLHYDKPRTQSEVKSSANKAKQAAARKLSNKQSSEDRPGLTGSLTSSSVDFVDKTEHIYESELAAPLYESAELDGDGLPDTNGSIYENTEFVRDSQKKKSTPQEAVHDQPSSKVSAKGAALLKKKPKKHSPDDYEDPDIMDEDYIDMDTNQEQDQDNMYIDPEDLRKGNMDSSTASPESPPAARQNGVKKGCDENAGQLFDDDYIEMDPLYVEPPLESDGDNDEQDGGTLKANNNPKNSPKQSPISRRPLPPPPYSSPTPEEKSPLVKTKSLENIIAAFNAKSKSADSPKLDQKAKKVAPNPPPRVPASSNSSSSMVPAAVSGSSTSEQSKSSKMKLSARKMFSSGGSKKRDSETNLNHEKVSSTKSVSSSQERSNSPSGSMEGNVGGRIPRPPLIHTQSTPSFEVALPKTYVSIASYSSPAKECLSFAEGDKCVLIQSSPDGWWLVNIGGQEGWTPGEYWKEDVREAQIPKPPSFAAPRKALLGSKPRSQTVSDITSSVEVSPSWLRSNDPAPSHDDNRGLNKSIDNVFSSPSKVTPTSNSSGSRLKKSGPIRQTSDPKPQKPLKPILPNKPVVAAKPTNVKQSPRTSPTPNSPPTNKRRQGLTTPSPPPQLTGNSEGMDSRDVMSTAINGHKGNVKESSPIGDYEQLDEISTIEGSPWYCGKMERTQAEQYLMEHGRQREFLIRERTSKTGFYALSVRYHFSCKHFNIDPSPEGHYVMGMMTFPSIEHIIIHYQQNSLFIYDGQHVTLSQPVKKRPRAFESSRHNH